MLCKYNIFINRITIADMFEKAIKIILNSQCTQFKQRHTHPHTHLTARFPGLPGWAGTRKVKPIWILLKQETVSGSGISWAICKSAPRYRQITTPASHHSVFLQAGCPSCRPTNSVKAMKATNRSVSKKMGSVCNFYQLGWHSLSEIRVSGQHNIVAEFWHNIV